MATELPLVHHGKGLMIPHGDAMVRHPPPHGKGDEPEMTFGSWAVPRVRGCTPQVIHDSCSEGPLKSCLKLDRLLSVS